MKLPKTPRDFNTIWVIVDYITKSFHFITIRESLFAKQVIYIYMKEVVSWHGVSILVVSDMDTRFASYFGSDFMRILVHS